jgi:hypothetical protein
MRPMTTLTHHGEIEAPTTEGTIPEALPESVAVYVVICARDGDLAASECPLCEVYFSKFTLRRKPHTLCSVSSSVLGPCLRH